MNKEKFVKKGMSLIVLVVTIIVILVLIGAVILTFTNNNSIDNAKEAVFKSNLAQYNSELRLKIIKKTSDDNTFKSTDINATTWDGNNSNITGTIKEYIKTISKKDGLLYEIRSGKLVYVGSNDIEKEWAEKIIANDAIVKTGLLVWFDGYDFTNSPQTTNLEDKSGNDHKGIVNNFSYNTNSGSDSKGGIVLDGINDYINTNTSYNFLNDFAAGEYTVEVKMKKGTNIISGESLVYGETIAASSIMTPYFMWLTVKNGEIRINSFGANTGTFANTTGANIIPGNEYFIQVVVKKGEASKILVNGEVKATFTAGAVTPTSIGYITLGDLRINRDIRFSGTIKTFRLYNRVLDDSELMKNYNVEK